MLSVHLYVLLGGMSIEIIRQLFNEKPSSSFVYSWTIWIKSFGKYPKNMPKLPAISNPMIPLLSASLRLQSFIFTSGGLLRSPIGLVRHRVPGDSLQEQTEGDESKVDLQWDDQKMWAGGTRRRISTFLCPGPFRRHCGWLEGGGNGEVMWMQAQII